MGFAGSDAFASLSFPISLRRGPLPKYGGANDKLDRLFYDSIARRRQGWTPITVWECELSKDFDETMERAIGKVLENVKEARP